MSRYSPSAARSPQQVPPDDALRKNARPIHSFWCGSVGGRSQSSASDRSVSDPSGRGAAIAALTVLAVESITAVTLDVRPAAMSDIELARNVRSAVPSVDELSPNMVRVRFAMNPKVAEKLEPIVANADAPDDQNWLVPLMGRSSLTVDPGRIEALTDLADYLGTFKPDDRRQMLDRLMSLMVVTYNDASQKLLEAIGRMPLERRRTLANNPELDSVLESVADMSAAAIDTRPADSEHQKIREAFLHGDDDLLRLLGSIIDSSPQEREVLVWVLAHLHSHDAILGRALTAVAMQNRVLIGTVERRLSPQCSIQNYEACK
jgi:hypothetical protein